MQETVNNAYHIVRDGFEYTSDMDNFGKREDWREHLDEVNDGSGWKDDCDGFALTCAMKLSEAGIPDEAIRIMYCKTETGGGHLVAAVDLEDDTLILDNRQRYLVSAAELPRYEFISGMRLSEAGTWRKIT